MARHSLRYAMPVASVLHIFPASAQQTLSPRARLDRDVAKVDAYHLLLNNHAATTAARVTCMEGQADLGAFLAEIKSTKDWGLVGFREMDLRPALRRAQKLDCPDVPPPESPGYIRRFLDWAGIFAP